MKECLKCQTNFSLKETKSCREKCVKCPNFCDNCQSQDKYVAHRK